MKAVKGIIVGLWILLFLASTAGFGQSFPIISQFNLVWPRTGHTATELLDHRILVAGGENAGGVLTSAEILTPCTAGSAVPRPMLSPRAYHAACLLPERYGGGVLITGGKDDRGNVLRSSEIFNTGTADFIQDGIMNFPRSGHTATPLADGKILIVGGDEGGTVELFDPERRTYSLLMPMGVPRRLHSAILLNSGEVLVVGGTDMLGTSLLSAEIIDPQAPEPTLVFNNLSEARIRPDLRLLPDGKVQVVGGNAHKTFETYDPAWRVFKAAVPVLAAGHHPVEILRSGTRSALFGGEYLPGTLPVDIGALLGRTGQSLTEIDLYRVAFVTGGTDSDGQTLSSAFWIHTHPARVTTDFTDYVMGETVVISGQGWSPGETVSLNVRDVASGEQFIISAFADASGNFSDDRPDFLGVEPGSSYLLTARSSSAAYMSQASFQVSPAFLQLEIQPSTPTFPGGSAEFQTSVCRWDDPAGSFDAILVVLGPPEGPPAPPDTEFIFPPEPLHFEEGALCAFFSVTVNTSASTPLGEYPFSIKAYRIDDPGVHAFGTGTLVVQPEFLPPVIISHPASATRTVGESVTFSASVEAQDPLTYQWVKRDTGPVAGATAESYTIPYVTAGDAGQYYVEISSPGGSATSDLAVLTVNRAVPGIVWDVPPEIPYGVSLGSDILNAQAFHLDTPVAGTYEYDPPEGTLLVPGMGQSLTVVFTPTDGVNFESASGWAMIDVSPGIPDIAWPRPEDIVYGTALGSTQLNATASFEGIPIQGDWEYLPAGGTVLNAGEDQLLTVCFTPREPHLYAPISATTTISVGRAMPTITWAKPEDITSGTPLGDAQLNADASVDGSFEYVPGHGTVLAAGSHLLTATFTPSDSANCHTATAEVTINVIQAPVTITWSNPPDMVYGTALDGGQLSATADVQGTFTYTPSAGTILDAGPSQILHVEFIPGDPITYAGASADVTITVLKAVPTISWANPADIVYGMALDQVQLNATASVPGTLTYTPEVGTLLDAGLGQSLHVDFVPNDSENYDPISEDVFINVTPAPLTVKADDKSKSYGAALPEFTASYTGFVAEQGPGDLAGSLVCSTSANEASPVGTYPITPSGQTSTNYDINYAAGTLSISPVPLTVKAENISKVLAAPLPAFTAAFNGFVQGESPGVLDGTLAFRTAATPASPIGSYPVTPFGLTSNNYEIIWLDGILSILYADPDACAGGHVILPPIKAEGTSVFKKGSTVPAKIKVFDANCSSVGTPGVVASFRLVRIIYGTATDVDEEVYSTTPDTAFRWSPEDELWIFNISTKSLSANQTYVYRITLNDGSVIDFQFGLK